MHSGHIASGDELKMPCKFPLTVAGKIKAAMLTRPATSVSWNRSPKVAGPDGRRKAIRRVKRASEARRRAVPCGVSVGASINWPNSHRLTARYNHCCPGGEKKWRSWKKNALLLIEGEYISWDNNTLRLLKPLIYDQLMFSYRHYLRL